MVRQEQSYQYRCWVNHFVVRETVNYCLVTHTRRSFQSDQVNAVESEGEEQDLETKVPVSCPSGEDVRVSEGENHQVDLLCSVADSQAVFLLLHVVDQYDK